MPFWKLRKRSKQKPSPASIPSQSPGNQYENIYDDCINPCKTQKSSQWSKLQHEDVQDSHLKVRGLERELETHNANVKYFTEDLDCSRQEIVEQRKMVRSALKNARKEHLEKLLGRRCQERFEFERRLDTLALSEFLVDHKLDDFTEHTILSKGRSQVIWAKVMLFKCCSTLTLYRWTDMFLPSKRSRLHARNKPWRKQPFIHNWQITPM